jgi:hypothetical protein
MVITRQLFQAIGGFDEGLDGALCCLRDYVRRAGTRGFLTFQVPGPAVSSRQERILGSEKRREERVQLSLALFKERWGESASFVVDVPRGVELDLLRKKLDLLLKGARHGDSFRVLMPAALYKKAREQRLDLLHENIGLVPLPRLSGARGRRRVFQAIAATTPALVSVAAIDGIPFPWSENFLLFTELSERIMLGYL